MLKGEKNCDIFQVRMIFVQGHIMKEEDDFVIFVKS